jgi:hypothetical protein
LGLRFLESPHLHSSLHCSPQMSNRDTSCDCRLAQAVLVLHVPALSVTVSQEIKFYHFVSHLESALEPLKPVQVSIHEETGQKKDIVEYVTSVVHSDTRMGKWRDQDQKLIIDTLSDKADGM